jgi:hypothetical protein
MALWQAQMDFALTVLQTSDNVTAGTMAAAAKLLAQAHASWTQKPTEEDVEAGAGKPAPCVPMKGLRRLLKGMCMQAEADTVWPLKAAFGRLLRLYADQPEEKGSAFFDGALRAVMAAVPLPEEEVRPHCRFAPPLIHFTPYSYIQEHIRCHRRSSASGWTRTTCPRRRPRWSSCCASPRVGPRRPLAVPLAILGGEVISMRPCMFHSDSPKQTGAREDDLSAHG